ncbi:MAG: hypothetical protein ACM3II_00780, partial [Rhodospirillaceae bacterium]
MASVVRLRVAVEAPRHTALEPLLSYTSEQTLPPGTLINVPLGRREVCAIVWDEGDGGADPASL